MSIDPAADRLTAVRARIEKAASGVGRTADQVTLIAVSKTFPADAIVPVLAAGQRVFGENRVQEAAAKWPKLREEFPGVELHLIGALQSNKAREAVELFDTIHALDRLKLAEAIADTAAKVGRCPTLFVQVNTGLEPQKAGLDPRDTAAFVADCQTRLGLPVVGLMCIPPVDEEPALHFGLLRKLADEIGLKSLSMGMSSDFETAIELGATHVRVGSAIFGHRDPH